MWREDGSEAVPVEYQYLDDLGENGLALAQKDNKWGYIDKDGRTVIDFIYDGASSFSENGLAAVFTGGKYGYIDKNGKKVIPFEYTNAGKFADAGDGNFLAAVCLEDRYGTHTERHRHRHTHTQRHTYRDTHKHPVSPKNTAVWAFPPTGNPAI